ncbi:hypothetical protein [Candidatus Mycobacterium methanotrophicum]|nr:hypothetical protein [Candidatus Mycobacterium methanotrophicum]
MTDHPIDSTTRRCCGGIGRHVRGCTGSEVPEPAGATQVNPWFDGARNFTGSSWEVPLDCPYDRGRACRVYLRGV